MPVTRTFLALALVAMSAGSPAAAQVTVVPVETVAKRLLDAQNAERVRLGLKPLVWSAKLAEHARKWAQTLATSDMFEHSPVGADGGEGENLWFGSKGDYSPEEMIGFFVDEAKMFKRGMFPDVSTTGNWLDVGHYTQLMWQDTREVGCTIVSNTRRDFLVCRYWPAGNVAGKPVFDYGLPKPAAAPALAPVVKAEPLATKNVSPATPKKRVSKKRRRGG